MTEPVAVIGEGRGETALDFIGSSAGRADVAATRIEHRRRADCSRYAEAQGWPWEDPVLRSVREFRARRVFTNADERGGNVTVWVDASTGKVRRGGFAPR